MVAGVVRASVAARWRWALRRRRCRWVVVSVASVLIALVVVVIGVMVVGVEIVVMEAVVEAAVGVMVVGIDAMAAGAIGVAVVAVVSIVGMGVAGRSGPSLVAVDRVVAVGVGRAGRGVRGELRRRVGRRVWRRCSGWIRCPGLAGRVVAERAMEGSRRRVRTRRRLAPGQYRERMCMLGARGRVG
jgi:hypothetical protein